jgi:hypothetical protein
MKRIKNKEDTAIWVGDKKFKAMTVEAIAERVNKTNGVKVILGIFNDFLIRRASIINTVTVLDTAKSVKVIAPDWVNGNLIIWPVKSVTSDVRRSKFTSIII